jgi:hypothetical protein
MAGSVFYLRTAFCIDNTVKTFQCQASIDDPTSEEPGVAKIFIIVLLLIQKIPAGAGITIFGNKA